MLVAVDLAAKMSAACVMDDDGNVVDQFDSWGVQEDEFLFRICEPWYMGRPFATTFNQQKWTDGPPAVLVIEDLPHKLPFMTLIKTVCRMQGRIQEKMDRIGYKQDVLWVPPATWQRTYGIGTAKGAAKLVQPKAEELGYTVPLDYTVYKGKDRAAARKVNTDYCSAYLIGRWATEYFKEHGTYDAPTTQRF